MEDYDCECGGTVEVLVQVVDTDLNKPWVCQCNKCMTVTFAYEG